MLRELRFTPTADAQMKAIQSTPALNGIVKQVNKALGCLETNLRSKSLQTHKHESLSLRYGREIFEAYVQQRIPGAYRIFWHYGDDDVDKKGKRISIITIIAIVPQPPVK